jgi:hypothetical protein
LKKDWPELEVKMTKTLILVKKEKDYLTQIFDMVKKSRKKVSYVTFNKTPDFIIESAKKYGISKERFCFIDCITPRIKCVNDSNSAICIRDSDNIDEIGKGIVNAVGKKYNFVVFDSLSNFLIYNSINDAQLYDSLGKLFKSFGKNKVEFVFVCYENDVRNYALDKTVTLFDRFIKSSGLI